MKSKVHLIETIPPDLDKVSMVYEPGPDMPVAMVEFCVADSHQGVQINVDGVTRFVLVGLPPGSEILMSGKFVPVKVEKH